MYRLFWIFALGSFFGVVIETLWCGVRFKKIESRKGLIWGPFNLVYGFGALLMTLCLIPLQAQRDLYILFAGAALGGIWEYLCSFLQEKMFGSVSWNYKSFPLNLHGRTHLLYCLFWGILALIWVRDICPRLFARIPRQPSLFEGLLTAGFLLFLLCDTIISAAAVFRMRKRKENMFATTKLQQWLDLHYPDEKLIKIYPNMQFI